VYELNKRHKLKNQNSNSNFSRSSTVSKYKFTLLSDINHDYILRPKLTIIKSVTAVSDSMYSHASLNDGDTFWQMHR